jgi:hypothetical protein
VVAAHPRTALHKQRAARSGTESVSERHEEGRRQEVDVRHEDGPSGEHRNESGGSGPGGVEETISEPVARVETPERQHGDDGGHEGSGSGGDQRTPEGSGSGDGSGEHESETESPDSGRGSSSGPG